MPLSRGLSCEGDSSRRQDLGDGGRLPESSSPSLPPTKILGPCSRMRSFSSISLSLSSCFFLCSSNFSNFSRSSSSCSSFSLAMRASSVTQAVQGRFTDTHKLPDGPHPYIYVRMHVCTDSHFLQAAVCSYMDSHRAHEALADHLNRVMSFHSRREERLCIRTKADKHSPKRYALPSCSCFSFNSSMKSLLRFATLSRLLSSNRSALILSITVLNSLISF